MTSPRLLIVGYPGDVHLGGHLLDAARTLGLTADLCDVRAAFDGPPLLRSVLWRFGDRRPVRMRQFGRHLLDRVAEFAPDVVIATGMAPIEAETIGEMSKAGATATVFLTDDPWNAAHRASWFLRALPAYDVVYSPRPQLLRDLARAGVRRVVPLAFAYNPRVHFPDDGLAEGGEAARAFDAVVVGGADAERVALVRPLVASGLRVGLFGGYWDRYRDTRAHARGVIDAAGLRRVAAAARVSVGLVRRANRDDHAMRSFEAPAMRACVVADRTPGHEALYGEDGAAVRYFQTGDELVRVVTAMVNDPADQMRLRAAVHARITEGAHTYVDRLRALVDAAGQ